MDIDGRESKLCGARQIEQLFDELIYSVDLADHDISKFFYRGVAVGGAAQQLRGSFNPAKGITDLMGQASGQRSHQRQSVSSLQIFFQFFAMPIVAQQHDRANKLSVAVLQGRYRDADRSLSAPAGYEVAFAPGAFLARGSGFL